MDIKIEIKEEPGLEGASEEMKCLSKQIPEAINSIKEHKNDVAISRNNYETTEKPFISNACFSNELTLKKEYSNITAACVNTFAKNLKTEIKEDSFCKAAPVENSVCTEHVVDLQTNISKGLDGSEIDTKISIDEDPVWLEETSMEIKTFKIPAQLQNEVQDTTMSTNGSHKYLRCYSGSEMVDGSDMSSIFSNANLEMKDNFKMMECKSDLKKNRLTDIGRSDIADTSHERNGTHLTSVIQESQYDDEASSCKNKKLLNKRHKCQICEKTFTRKAHLRAHKFVHEGTKPYQCNICNEGFIRKSSLKEHNMKHEGKKPYSCSICEKSFVRMDNLNKHSEIHKIQKPTIVSCRLCKESFTHMSHFKAHKKVHAGKALPLCQICGKSYTFMSELKRHIISHGAIKQHQCPICQKRFTHPQHFNRHIITFHSNAGL